MGKTKTFICSLLVMALWGLLYPLVKFGYGECGIVTIPDILVFIGIRFTVSGIAITAFSLIRNPENFKKLKGRVLSVFLAGFFTIVLHYTLNYWGIMLSDSSKSAILKQAGSIIYVCFSFMFFKDDKVTVKKLVGVALGFCGIIAINITGGGLAFKLGDLLIIASSVCIMFGNIISKKTFAEITPILATGISQFFGGAIVLIAGFSLGGGITFSGAGGFGVLGLICAASIISYCLWYVNITRVKLSNLYIIKFAEPLFACVFSALLLGENVLRIEYAAAFLLISTGIYISNK